MPERRVGRSVCHFGPLCPFFGCNNDGHPFPKEEQKSMAEALVDHLEATYALDAFPTPTQWSLGRRMDAIFAQGDPVVRMALSGQNRESMQACRGAMRLLENDRAFQFYWKRHVSLRILKKLEDSLPGTMENAVMLFWSESSANKLQRILMHLSPLEECAPEEDESTMEMTAECEICMEDVSEYSRVLHEDPLCDGHGLVCERCISMLDHNICYVCSEPIVGFEKREHQYCCKYTTSCKKEHFFPGPC